jgi:uncharacterized protein YxjI
MSAPTAERERALAALAESDRFLIQQVLRPLVNEYRISVPAPGSTEEGEPLLFVRQKRMKIKEDIRFRLDPERDEQLFMIKSKSVFEVRGRHEVLDESGQPIGLLEKNFARSLFRSHWHVRDTAGSELLEAHEQSWLVALVRRFADNLGDFAAPLAYLPLNFALMRDGERVGTYRRVMGKLRDRYVLELDGALDGDRRLVLAFAVALDALQDR